MQIHEIKTMLDNAGYYTSFEVIMNIYDLFNYSDEGIASMVLSGPTGCGKTKLMSILMEAHSGVMYSCNMTTTEKHLVAEPDLQNVILKNPTKVVRPKILAKGIQMANDNNKICVVGIDEFDKAPPSADYFMYELLQNGKLSGTMLGDLKVENPKKMVIIFGKNDFRELSEPLLRRGAYIELQYPKIAYVEKDIRSKIAGFDETFLELILNLYGLQLKDPGKFTKIATIQEMRIAMRQDMERQVLLKSLEKGKQTALRVTNIINTMAKTHSDRVGLKVLLKNIDIGGGRIVFDKDDPEHEVQVNVLNARNVKDQLMKFSAVITSLESKVKTLEGEKATESVAPLFVTEAIDSLNARMDVIAEDVKKLSSTVSKFNESSSVKKKVEKLEKEIADFVELFNKG